MGQEEELIFVKLTNDINSLRKSIEHAEMLAQRRDETVQILTKQIEQLSIALFKNDFEPQNTILARIQKIEAFMKLLDETRFKLSGSLALTMWAMGAMGALAGIVFIFLAFAFIKNNMYSYTWSEELRRLLVILCTGWIAISAAIAAGMNDLKNK
jgi:hypothetical protein